MNDTELTRLCEALPPQLQSLSLYLSGCVHITDISVGAIQIPISVTSLHLDLSYLKALQGAGLVALAKKLPPALTKVSLQIVFRPQTSQNEVRLTRSADVLIAWMSGLPTSIQEIYLEIQYNMNFDSLVVAAMLPPKVRVLELHISPGLNGNDDGSVLVRFAEALPDHVEILHIKNICSAKPYGGPVTMWRLYELHQV